MAVRGSVEVNREECKGCGLCVASCPPKCLELESGLNTYGAHPARYTGEGCTGCGICFFCCPEPGGITVYRSVQGVKAAAAKSDVEKEVASAATL